MNLIYTFHKGLMLLSNLILKYYFVLFNVTNKYSKCVSIKKFSFILYLFVYRYTIKLMHFILEK